MSRPAEGGARRDPGLQAERTLLAWQRTVIVLVVVALLYVRDPFQEGAPQDPGGTFLRAAVALLPVGIAIAAAVHVRRRWRADGRRAHGGAAHGPAAPLARSWMRILISAGTCVFAIAVALSALIG
ncbi:DUF202 domain-containing protein [Nocardiopsis potens]|uniref:DUF202 domain-containing protein n=1 Tax=Nocardiopsis potens TaxID=1246458 RepID=UPI00034CD9A3|nr:DUF202 domain-containing protein [Nocardiopsis potens]